MLIIPAIDILEGRCVRLFKGDYHQVSEYGEDLHAITARWETQGASRIHLVDLDGAKAGKPINHKIICQLAGDFPHIAFETGGGIRSMADAELYFNNGMDFVILGSVACTDPQTAMAIIHRFAHKVLLGLDSQQGKVKIAGWQDDSGKSLLEALAPFSASKLGGIIHTDINRDGTLAGANLQASAELAQQSGHRVIASGGISNMQDVEELCSYAGVLEGAITGKALYENRLALSEAIARAKQATHHR